MEQSPASPDSGAKPATTSAQPTQPSQLASASSSVSPETAAPKPSGTKGSQDKRYHDRLLDDFIKLSNPGFSAEEIYRSRPYWSSISAEKLTKDAIEIYKNIPTARPAVLSYIGSLVHESVNHKFTLREAHAHSKVSDSPLSAEEAVSILMDQIQSSLKKHSGGINLPAAKEILKWICSLCCELYVHNHIRQISRQFEANKKPEQFLFMMKGSRSVARALKLLDKVMEMMLSVSDDDCLGILFDASRSGANFYWIWIHTCDMFPSVIVEKLSVLGHTDFVDFIKKHEEAAGGASASSTLRGRSPRKLQFEPVSVQLANYVAEKSPKLMSFSYIFAFLATKRNNQLMHEFTRLIKEGFSAPPPYNGRLHESPAVSLLFVLWVAHSSPFLLNGIITFNETYVTPTRFVDAAKMVSSAPPGIFTAKNWSDMETAVTALDLDTIGILIEPVLRSAFDPTIFRSFDAMGDGSIQLVRDGAMRMVSACMDVIVRSAHSRPNADGSMAIRAFSTGSSLQDLINWTLVSVPGRAPLLQYLHSIAVCHGENKAAEILARYLMNARDESEIGVAVAFATSVQPFFPGVFSRVYENLRTWREFYRDSRDDGEEDYIADLRLLDNIRVLMQWETASRPADYAKYIGFYPATYLGSVLTLLLSRTIDIMRKAVESDDKRRLATIILAMCRFIEATGYSAAERTEILTQSKAVVHWVAMPMQFLYKAAVQLAACLRMSLHLVGGGIADADSRALIEQLCLVIASFAHEKMIEQQRVPFYALFLEAFAHGIMGEAKELYADSADIDAFAVQEINSDASAETTPSLLDEMRALDLRMSVAALAHSGKIAPARRRIVLDGGSEDDALRLALTMEMLHAWCVPRPSECTAREGRRAQKIIAHVACECACVDALGADYAFYEWECEREAIARYVEIARRVETSPLLQHILAMAAECGGMLWLLLPVMKAQLAGIVAAYENAADRSKRPTAALLEKTDRWMILMRKSDLLPSPFAPVMEMLPYISAYEGYILLAEIWRYFVNSKMTHDGAASMHKVAANDKKRDSLPPVEEYLAACTSVIAQNIAELGHLLPLLLPQEVELARKTVELEDASR